MNALPTRGLGSGSPRHRGFAAALAAQLVAVAAGVAFAGNLLRDNRPAATATEARNPWFEQRRARLEARLAAHPGDDLARIRLAECLTSATVIDAQRTFPDGEPGSDPTSHRYRSHVAEAVLRSPDAQLAETAARQVLRESKDPELRFRAYKTLATAQYFLQNPRSQERFLRAAFQEHPCPRCRDLLASVQYHINAEWGLE